MDDAKSRRKNQMTQLRCSYWAGAQEKHARNGRYSPRLVLQPPNQCALCCGVASFFNPFATLQHEARPVARIACFSNEEGDLCQSTALDAIH
eukprot:2669662-Amphidinium_carterae.2